MTADGINSIELGANASAAGIVDVTGGAGNDTFLFSNGTYFSTTALDGGLGTNTVELVSNAQTVADTAFANVTAGTIANFVTADGTNSIELGANASTAGIATLTGGTGADSFDASGYGVGVTLLGGNGNAQSGADTLIGGGGADWLQGWTNTTASQNSSNDTLTGGAGVDTFVLGNAVSNAYGQFNAVNPSNKFAQITDYDVTTGDLLRVWSNDFDVAAFANNATDTITLTKTVGAGSGNAYTLQYSQGAGSGTADLYMNGTNRLVASMSYTGDMTTATIGIFELA